jgi:hypothetical protein
VCPSCQLKHSRRPTSICPRCNTALDGGPADTESPTAAAAETADVNALATPSATPALPSLATGAAGLGNLAQSARSKQLSSARNIMLFVGIMTIVLNAIFFALVEGQVQEAIDKEIAKLPSGMVADPVKVADVKGRAVRAAHLVDAGAIVLGLLFLGCAALVNTKPVPATITALCLYVGGAAVFGAIDPSTLATGIILKVVIVVALAKAVQAAIAYQKEESEAVGA